MAEESCQNCGVKAALRKVKGYRVCPDCEVKAHLPFFLRDSQ